MESTLPPVELFPLGKKDPTDRETAFSLYKQILEEFVRLRYVDDGRVDHFDTAKYIDQAKSYFDSGVSVEWRSSGLVFYYSFLNFVKAYLIHKRIVYNEFDFTFDSVKSMGTYHGLSSTSREADSILEFEIEIHPPYSRRNNKYNLFSLFYNSQFDQWPFEESIKIKLKDILPYCHDVSGEIYDLYQIIPRIVFPISMMRVNEDQAWFEVMVSNQLIGNETTCAEIFRTEMNDWITGIVEFEDFKGTIRSDWCNTYKLTPKTASQSTIFQGGNVNVENGDTVNAMMQVQDKCLNDFEKYCYPLPFVGRKQSWQFVPRITLSNTNMYWHPMLSDYLFSFALSDILRYRPYMIMEKTKDQHLGQAWCNQSPLSVIRYFLMIFTKPPLRITKI